jgi:hypothetical protein
LVEDAYGGENPMPSVHYDNSILSESPYNTTQLETTIALSFISGVNRNGYIAIVPVVLEALFTLRNGDLE